MEGGSVVNLQPQEPVPARLPAPELGGTAGLVPLLKHSPALGTVGHRRTQPPTCKSRLPQVSVLAVTALWQAGQLQASSECSGLFSHLT